MYSRKRHASKSDEITRFAPGYDHYYLYMNAETST